MPFTASHAAAVIPFARLPLSTSALVIGSMVPDLPLFAPAVARYGHTHSLVGILTADALLGAGAFVVWHCLLAPPLLAGLSGRLRDTIEMGHPLGLRERIAGRGAPEVYVSLVVGAATHVVWDEFTHTGRWGTEHIPWLAEMHGPLPGTGYVQHFSSLIGAIALAAWGRRWLRSQHLTFSDASVSKGAQLVGVAVLIAGGVAAARAIWPFSNGGFQLPAHFPFLATTRGIAGSAAMALVMAAGWHLVSRRGRPRDLRPRAGSAF